MHHSLIDILHARILAFKMFEIDQNGLVKGLYDWHVCLTAADFFNDQIVKFPNCLPKQHANVWSRARFNQMILELAGVIVPEPSPVQQAAMNVAVIAEHIQARDIATAVLNHVPEELFEPKIWIAEGVKILEENAIMSKILEASPDPTVPDLIIERPEPSREPKHVRPKTSRPKSKEVKRVSRKKGTKKGRKS